MREQTDVELLTAYAQGEEAAFTELVARHGRAIKGFSMRLLHSPELAEEVYVETFLRLARLEGRWEQRGTVRGYLFTVARRLCLDRLRRRQVARRALPRVIVMEENRAVRPSPEAQASMGEQAALLEQALATLPPTHRDVLLMRTVHGLSSAEVGAAIGATEDQVHSKLSYARRRLRQAMARLAEPTATVVAG